jgi:hypothetical protein
MAFVDWEHGEDFSETFNIQTDEFINGSSALRVTNISTISGESALIARVTSASAINRFYTYGRIRTLIRFVQGSGGSPDDIRAGIWCMGSSASISSLPTGGNLYLAYIFPDTSNNVLVRRSSSGADDLTAALVLATATKSLAVGQDVAFQLEWRASSSLIGGTRLRVSVGDDPGYGDLNEIIDVVDGGSSALLVSAGGEGLLIQVNTGGTCDVIFDDTVLTSFS